VDTSQLSDSRLVSRRPNRKHEAPSYQFFFSLWLGKKEKKEGLFPEEIQAALLSIRV
jgi:hypothetical protein